MTPKVVALLGVRGSGKTVVLRHLLEVGFLRVRFGDPARAMLAAGFNCSPREMDGDLHDRSQRRFGGHSTQTLMHTLTHEWGRRLHSDLFVNEWRRRAELCGGLVVADDLMRPNEALAVRDMGGIVVRVIRPDAIETQNPHALRAQAQIKADVELLNHGREELALVAEEFVKGLGEHLRQAAA